MNLTELFKAVKHKKARHRVGRGEGSGSGCTAGKGHKGQGARAGYAKRAGFEGGQMPLFRRLPKVGFNNAEFATEFVVINVSTLSRFPEGATIAIEDYKKAGIVKRYKDGVKILGEGEVPKNLTVTAHRFSASAKQKIEAAGGKVIELSPAPTQEELAKQKPVRRGGKKRKPKAVAVAAAAPQEGE